MSTTNWGCYPDREIQTGEPCPWCSAIVLEMLTSSPIRCPKCKGALRPVPAVGIHPQDPPKRG